MAGIFEWGKVFLFFGPFGDELDEVSTVRILRFLTFKVVLSSNCMYTHFPFRDLSWSFWRLFVIKVGELQNSGVCRW